MSLKSEIEHAVNRASAENGSNTPDFILAEYLTTCLAAFDVAVLARENWYGCWHEAGKFTAPDPTATAGQETQQ